MERVHEKDLKTLSLEILQEMFERQSHLLTKRCVLSKLIDKGESVRKLHNALAKEINLRKEEMALTSAFSQLTVTSSSDADFLNEKHVQYVCAKESVKHEEKFKPFATLIRTKTTSPSNSRVDTDISSAVDPKWTMECSKLIPLSESLLLQMNQINRVKEEWSMRQVDKLELAEGTVEEEKEEIDSAAEIFNQDNGNYLPKY